MSTGAEPQPEQARRHTQRALFDPVAARYDAARPGYPPQAMAFLAATAGLRPGAAVLEVGCGTGQLTAPLARAGYRVTAIDIGPSLVAAARRRLAGLDVTFLVYLGWAPAVQAAFTAGLHRLLEPGENVPLTRRATVTMAQVPA